MAIMMITGGDDGNDSHDDSRGIIMYYHINQSIDRSIYLFALRAEVEVTADGALVSTA